MSSAESFEASLDDILQKDIATIYKNIDLGESKDLLSDASEEVLSFLEAKKEAWQYVYLSLIHIFEEQKKLPKCLTMSLAAYIAFYSNDIQERTADGLICKRPAGNTYKIQDDAWNGDKLHEEGFKGQGMTIAVIDAGFHNADKITFY